MLLSRVAETTYWMSRYLERAENTARIIMVNANLLLDLPRGIAPGWEPLLAITGSVPLFEERWDEVSEKNVVKFLVSDTKNPSSILSTLARARENFRTTRAIFPHGAWEILNDLYYFAGEKKAQGWSRKGRYDYLKQIIRSCQMLSGNLSGSMSRDHTYDFLRIGRNVERADMTSRVLDVRASNLIPVHGEELKPFGDIQWKSVLDSLAGYQMYRRHVHVRVSGCAVLSYLVKDKEFPRSILFCLDELDACLRALPENDTALRTLARAKRMAGEMDARGLVKERLNDFVNEYQILLARVHDQISETYFRVERQSPGAVNDSEMAVLEGEHAA